MRINFDLSMTSQSPGQLGEIGSVTTQGRAMRYSPGVPSDIDS